MKIQSLGIKTDLIFHNFEAEVSHFDNFIAVKTRTNPSFRWGNYLIFDSPPKKADFKIWQKLFIKHIGQPPEINHFLFAWDNPRGELGEIDDFIKAGYKLESDIVQTSSELIKPKIAKIDIELRLLDFKKELQAVIENHVLVRGDEEEIAYREFWQNNAKSYLKMIEAGAGQWFGAFVDDKLVADMGLFFKDDVARYQAVITLPEFQNLGIASNLLYYVGQYGLENFGVKYLLIVADQNYHAKDIYRKLGFSGSEQSHALDWH